jgi:hypothetical protein
MTMLLVVRPGMLTTIQDTGRWGWQARGVSVAGPMDPYAHRLANALVGNSAAAATLEVTLTGPELECEDERMLAVTGADFDVALDDRSVPINTALVARAGSRLRFGGRRRGARVCWHRRWHCRASRSREPRHARARPHGRSRRAAGSRRRSPSARTSKSNTFRLGYQGDVSRLGGGARVREGGARSAQWTIRQ